MLLGLVLRGKEEERKSYSCLSLENRDPSPEKAKKDEAKTTSKRRKWRRARLFLISPVVHIVNALDAVAERVTLFPSPESR